MHMGTAVYKPVIKKLPIWLQTFSLMREVKGWLVYVDKTQYIWNLLDTPNSPKIFLSRPRRFWKSLLLDTFRQLFEWHKRYFEDLYIYDKWDWSETNTYPVMKIAFWDGIIKDGIYLNETLGATFNELSRKFWVELEEKNIPARFRELIVKVYRKYNKKVVVLIDEYDKPILDKIDDPEIAKDIREELKWFYSVLKWADEYLRFVFITWVTKFSQVSLFSGLNQLNDITLDSRYSAICGYTETEISDNFWPEWYLEWVERAEMKKWYNGYNFNATNPHNYVYNPFWILNFFDKQEYWNYWFKSATPTFLITLLQQKYYPIIDFENIKVWNEIMDSFDIENIRIETLMYQTGYLTIKEKKKYWNDIIYSLAIPNKEVRKSLNSYLMTHYLWFTNLKFQLDNIINIYTVLSHWNVDWFIAILTRIFAWIPYSNYTKNDISKYEWFYSSVLYSFLAWSWVSFIAEDFTNRWRIDFTLEYNNNVYIIELKVEKTGKEAFEQIVEMWYEEKYKSPHSPLTSHPPLTPPCEGGGAHKDIYLIGLNFDMKARNIWETH